MESMLTFVLLVKLVWNNNTGKWRWGNTYGTGRITQANQVEACAHLLALKQILSFPVHAGILSHTEL